MERFPVAKTPSDFTPISYRPKDAARALGVSLAHFNKLKAAGKIASRKDGAAVLIDREALIAYRNSLPVFARANLDRLSSVRRRAKDRA